MARETYGLLEAARRARGWMPRLKHDGQAIVLAAIVFYTDKAGVSDPSGWQAGMGRRSEISARRIFGELEDLGVIQQMGTRPTFNKSGRPKGGRVRMWSVCPTDHLDDQVGVVSQPITDNVPTDHETAPNRSPGRSPLNTESLNSDAYEKYEKLRQQGVDPGKAAFETFGNPDRTETASASDMDDALNNLAAHFDFTEVTG